MKKIIPAVFCLAVAAQLDAQSLRGSQSSVQRMYTRAVQNDLDFLRTSKGVYQSVRDGELVLVTVTMDMTLEKVSYPFVLPRTRDVLKVFARNYRAACGERLVVTSAARPRAGQPRNASPRSVHPTGMAIDFRRPAEPCLTFMRKELLALERQGVLEATEERRPVHFHVAVLQRGRFAPAAPAIATATTTTVTPQTPTISAPATPVTADSANGTVEAPAPAPASKPTASKPASSGSSKIHTVKRGDSLWEIAKRYGLTVTRLKSLNGMKGSTIRIGQKIRVG